MNTDSLRDIIDNGWMRVAILGVLAILALFLLVQTLSAAGNLGRSSSPATDTITVQASGQSAVAPDVARISFTVENSAATVADAQEKTTTQSNAAIEFVKSQGIPEKDIKTLYYNISPQYSYPQPCSGTICPAYVGSPKITGYQVSQSVQVTMRDLSKVGDMLSGLGGQGVQNLSGPSFALDDSTAGYNAARADAIEKAKQQARTLADQLGVRLGKIVNFSESSGGYPYPMVEYGRGGAMDAKSVAPTVPTGENTYSAQVSITYEIR
jgi:uncharacterized protein